MTNIDEMLKIRSYHNDKILVSLSGGLDSSTLLYYLVYHGARCSAVSFNYGSKQNKREIKAAKAICKELGISHRVIKLDFMKDFKSSLLDKNEKIPEGNYAEDNMKSTVVPNRNMIMWSILAGIAQGEGFSFVAGASHAGDHYQYPDTTPEFTKHLWHAIDIACNNEVHLLTPFNNITKIDIAKIAKRLGVPYNLTYSCYNGGEKHCGKCGTCVERLESFYLAGLNINPDLYLAANRWQLVTKIDLGKNINEK